jgi:TolA-binding protein
MDGNNVIGCNGAYGVWIDATSIPILGGISYGGDPAENSLYLNTLKEVYSQQTTQIVATYNYWGAYPPNSNRFQGNINYSNALPTDPNPGRIGIPKPVAKDPEGEEVNETGTINKEAREHFEIGYKHELAGEYAEAVAKFQFVIDTFPAELEASLALVHLAFCNHQLDRAVDTRSTLQSVAEAYPNYTVSGKAREMEAPDLIREGRYKEALANYSGIIESFPKDEMACNALFEKWQIYFNLTNEPEAAKMALEQYRNAYPNDDRVVVMQAAMGEISYEDVIRLAKEKADNQTAADSLELPSTFALQGNYPNPFNPGTVIQFALPEKCQVTIDIYNVLGQKIMRILDARLPAGQHHAHWNGQNEAGQKVSAGVYLCRMQAGDFVKTRKMTLLP